MMKNDEPAKIEISYLEALTPFTVSKIFFHNVQGKAWRMFLVLDSGKNIVLPINPECPGQILNTEQLKSDLLEFKEEIKKQKDSSINRLDNLKNNMDNILDNIG